MSESVKIIPEDYHSINPYLVASIGQGHSLSILNQTIPYYDKMISMIPLGHGRPNIPEFPEIDDHVTEALKQVCNGIKEPKQALEDAAAKSANLLGW
jgi:multiple sugar transport system substrate-binding protein